MKTDSNIKFNEYGQPVPYYGNTIISFLNQLGSQIFQEAVFVQNVLRESELAHGLVFLPPESFHMTVLTLCREIDRGSIYWPLEISENVVFHEIDRLLKKKVDSTSVPEGIMMEIDCCEISKILLKPYRLEDEEALNKYRNRVAEITGIRHKWHDRFRYHISLDYIFREWSLSEENIKNQLCQEMTEHLRQKVQPFVISNPQFVIFNNMMSYETELSKRGDLY